MERPPVHLANASLSSGTNGKGGVGNIFLIKYVKICPFPNVNLVHVFSLHLLGVGSPFPPVLGSEGQLALLSC